jgi:hypothetical protein
MSPGTTNSGGDLGEIPPLLEGAPRKPEPLLPTFSSPGIATSPSSATRMLPSGMRTLPNNVAPTSPRGSCSVSISHPRDASSPFAVASRCIGVHPLYYYRNSNT